MMWTRSWTRSTITGTLSFAFALVVLTGNLSVVRLSPALTCTRATTTLTLSVGRIAAVVVAVVRAVVRAVVAVVGAVVAVVPQMPHVNVHLYQRLHVNLAWSPP
jgi:uncharacterized protein (DUF58 family)